MNICPNASGCFLLSMDWIGSTMGSKSLARPRNFKLLLCPNNHQHDNFHWPAFTRSTKKFFLGASPSISYGFGLGQGLPEHFSLNLQIKVQ